ncbi:MULTISPECIES: YceD family protein [Craterilacuibacter]|uniref:Large ribosomal RNA subunit accumulation protein YceD n=1 Tax=Craterilacuibacter sinensis TaxID=2686017 RepID=A0A845BHG5_9NEIS|nr:MULTISPECIES: YceD family protein [Craterilacuibacter]MCL6261966.1 YceD family protein [Craterilacuibacter sp. RT1T]MCP9759770.1 metal-binding protein [Aquitalea sp. S1-19]MXR35572.1 metal-binding protein [Craterilacuibacter sinensis]RQW29381.1 metal-binding protein [Rhodobacteraceae bacterium CH30]
MSNPILIDPLAFGRDGQSRNGRRTIADLDERVLENLADNSGAVQFTAEGFMDGSRRPSLRLKVTGTVNVICQRCLEPMEYPIESEAVLTFFRDEEKLAAAVEDNEELDAVMAEEELDVIALVEDEIIMGLSLSPKHDQCGDELLEHGKAGKPNPFAVLAALKKPKSE